MKNKRICKTLSALCLTMVVAFGFTIPAFAQGSEQAPAAPAEDSIVLYAVSCFLSAVPPKRAKSRSARA